MNKWIVLLSVFFIFPVWLWSQEDFSAIEDAHQKYKEGKLEEAKNLYADLAKSKDNIPFIHSYYFDILNKDFDPSKIKKYLKKIQNWYPYNISYQVDEFAFYAMMGDENKSGNLLEKLKEENENKIARIEGIARALEEKNFYNESITFYQNARSLREDPKSYAKNLAQLYRKNNNDEKMMEEYVLFGSQDSQNLDYVKSMLQEIIADEDKKADVLEMTLLRKMQEEPDEGSYLELMIWLELQRKNFDAALSQAKVLDRLQNGLGEAVAEVGKVALYYKKWDQAIEIFSYLTKGYEAVAPKRREYEKMLIHSKEEKIKNTLPIDTASVRSLIVDYKNLINQTHQIDKKGEEMLNLAHLYAFYLFEVDTALQLLESGRNATYQNKELEAQIKLNLGDIYLLKGESWEATLLYSQVEKTNKETEIGYTAKLKNAKLNFYEGNFALAKSHLDILKKATTRHIANDALHLSVLIGDNTYMDSTDAIMQNYANIERLLFQKNYSKAKQELLSMLNQHSQHNIADEVSWQLYKIALYEQEYSQALHYLENILTQHSTDILADDAAFKKAEILDFFLNDKKEAMALYQNFLITFPGSMYTAEARKRFRILRGDFVNKP